MAVARFRLWRFRRRYRRALGQVALDNQLLQAADVQQAVDKFRANLAQVTTEEWRRYGLHERRWR